MTERRFPPTALMVTTMVDETAKAEMHRLGYDVVAWERMTKGRQDEMRLRALDRLRELAKS